MDKAQSEFQLVLEKTLQVQGSYDKDTITAFRGFSGLGETALKRKDFETAQKHFKQALEISPLDETAAYNVGEIFFSNQKIDEGSPILSWRSRSRRTGRSLTTGWAWST